LKFWIAEAQPRKPAGVVPLIVSRISRQRTGFTFLNSSVNQRSMVLSARAFRLPALRTMSLRSSHEAAEPGGVEGWVSQSVSDSRRSGWPRAKPWPIMPPMLRPI
jgi:hypothetical protein